MYTTSHIFGMIEVTKQPSSYPDNQRYVPYRDSDLKYKNNIINSLY